ncbi:MAG: tRNA pseudouridine(55) synthase TruB, partial [Chloroflexi bacterium]|nr:tRNA pseudouridine(55) synthase TruB [Chloroflexota bacterium]
RRGETVEIAPRPAHILRLDLTGWETPRLTLEVECGRGVYIRSLAHDLGQALGCGAHLTGLVRTRDASFMLDDAITLEDLAAAAANGDVRPHLRGLDAVMQAWPALTLNEAQVRLVRTGMPLRLGDETAGGEDGAPGRAYDASGQLVAVMRWRPDDGTWRPEKVFNTD